MRSGGLAAVVVLALACATPRSGTHPAQGTISGTAIDMLLPVPRAFVTLSGAGEFRRTATTDRAGAFTLTAPVGCYDLVAAFPGPPRAPRKTHRSVCLRADEVLRVTLSSADPAVVDPACAALTPPKFLEGPDITTASVAAFPCGRSTCSMYSGSLVIKCVVTETGAVQGCSGRQGFPYPELEESVIERLTQRRYEPAWCGYRALEVDYTFRINVTPPP